MLSTIKDSIILQANTDGISIKIPRTEIETLNNINKQFSNITNFTIEEVVYKKMVILTVNDYLAVKENGETKYKGDFEIDKELHKNNSMSIVPIALKEYFVNGIDYRQTIKNHNNIKDFCKGIKVKSNFKLHLHKVVKGSHIFEKGQKVTRYYISTNGGNLVKEYDDGRIVDCESGWKTTLLNKINLDVPIKNYNIDYTYYIKACERIIHQIEGNKYQLSLF